MLQTVCEALEKGCCLEIYYDELCIVGEVHAVGWDKAHNAAVLLYERFDTACEHVGEWRLLSLESARDLDVSGYFSEAPRPDYQPPDGQFERICCSVGCRRIPGVQGVTRDVAADATVRARLGRLHMVRTKVGTP